MNPLLLLPQQHRSDDAEIWRAAVRQGWETIRIRREVSPADMLGRPMVRYYGDLLHASQLPAGLPFKFSPIDPEVLSQLPAYTKRSLVFTRYGQLPSVLPEKAFIKPTSNKWFSARVYEAGEKLPDNLLPDDPVYVQDVVSFSDELRCFVIDGTIRTCCRYRINGVPWDICGKPPQELNFDQRIADTVIPTYVREICAQTQNRLPSGIVIDFGQLPTGDWALIEFNEAWASGICYCDPDECFSTIIASQRSSNITS